MADPKKPAGYDFDFESFKPEDFKSLKWGDLGRAGQAILKLYQEDVSRGMIAGGEPHASTTRPGFICSHVAPWIKSATWPAAAPLGI